MPESHPPPEPPEPSPAQPELERSALLRILDANFNRAAEGLRVLEDFARFALDDRHLTSLGKNLRHELTACRQELPGVELLAARDTSQDVGTQLQAAAEYRRGNVEELLHANAQRCAQSLRCLEEYSKLLPQTATAVRIESLRYRLYTWQRALAGTVEGCRQLDGLRLYVLLDGAASRTLFQQLVRELVGSGVDVLQLRDKHLGDRELLGRARVLRQETEGTATRFIMNDRPDLALLARADGVHIGQEELPVKEVRTLVGSRMLIGVSTHSLAQARQAVLDSADYLGCGPVFPSETKSFDRFPGLDLLREVAGEIRLPAFAIGGITPQNLPAVRQTGFTRVAVSSAVTRAERPAQAVAELRALLGE